jgi:hypothetical protein
VARRRIKAGEEITVDYGKDYFSAFIGKKKCRCDKCRERRRADRQRLKRRKLRRLKAKRRRGRHSARR